MPHAGAAAALASVALVGCTGSMSREGWQRANAWMMHPAPVQAPRNAPRPAVVRSLRLRAFADADYQAHAADWERRIVEQVGRANELLEVQFGVRFDVEVRSWDRADRGAPLREALRELRSVDRGGADWVVGFVGPVPEEAWQDHLGMAVPFRAELVLRAMLSPADQTRLAISYDTLSDEERRGLAEELRVHRETVAFLHEWAHTVGAVHECDGKWIMARKYGVLASSFSPESERLVRVALAHLGEQGPGARSAFRDAWRGEAARILASAWECPVLEKELSDLDALVVRAGASGGPAPAP